MYKHIHTRVHIEIEKNSTILSYIYKGEYIFHLRTGNGFLKKFVGTLANNSITQLSVILPSFKTRALVPYPLKKCAMPVYKTFPGVHKILAVKRCALRFMYYRIIIICNFTKSSELQRTSFSKSFEIHLSNKILLFHLTSLYLCVMFELYLHMKEIFVETNMVNKVYLCVNSV